MHFYNIKVMDQSRVLIFFIEFLYFIQIVLCDCKLIETPKDPHKQQHEEELLKRIAPLNGLQFTVTDGDSSSTKYIYHIRICDKVQGAVDEDIGAIQIIDDKHNNSLGLYTHADVMGGTDWLMLTYYDGKVHSKEHCNATGRITRMMIICDPDKEHGELRIIEEKVRSNTRFCFYLFEFGSKFACTKRSEPEEEHGLSSGGVFCVLFFTFVGTYFILGFLYQRLVAGAKGLEQIPHYTFWRAFGNLQADGCDYICRCGPRNESQAYRGIDDRLKDEERDDQLLNM